MYLIIKNNKSSTILVLHTLVYATGGRERLTPAVCVDIVRSVVTPKETLAGTDYQKIITLANDTIVKDILTVHFFILIEVNY